MPYTAASLSLVSPYGIAKVQHCCPLPNNLLLSMHAPLWRQSQLCCLQDFFEAGILPSDTDFRMLSASYLGSVPGIDLALLLDSQAYHMTVDTPDRIRPGTLQAYFHSALCEA